MGLFACLILGQAQPPRPDQVGAAILDLGSKDRQVQSAAIEKLGSLGDARALPALTALRESLLYFWTQDPNKTRLVIQQVKKKEYRKVGADNIEVVPLLDALTNQNIRDTSGGILLVETDSDSLKAVVATNALKLRIRPVLGRLGLVHPDPVERAATATRMGNDRDPAMVPLLEEALKTEQDRWVRLALDEAIHIIKLSSPDAAVRREAVRHLGEINGPNAKPILREMVKADEKGQTPEKDETVLAAARVAISSIEAHESMVRVIEVLFQALSWSSVLMIIALGLAVTYGVMGVINMAHGEMLMIGAYTTYFVQNWFAKHVSPEHFDSFFLTSVPFGFLTAAAFGLVLERLLLRFLYDRPLESLLATWGVSLVLQQAARRFIDAANVEVATPAFLSGGIQVTVGLVIAYNRIFVVVFGIVCMAAIYILLWKTRAGLRIRAVTQNRAMSSCLGVPTRRVDALTFAMGSGIAGAAGCAIVPIGTVGPDLGQTYIVDAFMVVVLGGVGKLLGTALAALGIGGISKVLEAIIGSSQATSKWGPRLAQVGVLTLLILFLQKRPSGLFAVKGRHAES